MWKSLFVPKVEQRSLQSRLMQARTSLPAPVFWLLGKPQSGKSSIIRALTGDSRAQIGDGMRPATATADLYDFPDAENCLIRFLDTRGLGSTGDDLSGDVALFRDQAHALIVVMKAMDPAQEPVADAVRAILKQRPQWPVIVVQTCLHEGYPDHSMNHVVPYPYDNAGREAVAPAALMRALAGQRRLFEGIDARFVAVDFTLDSDGYDPVQYGLDALWRALESALPDSIVSVVRGAGDIRSGLEDLYARAAFPHIVAWSLAAGSAGAIPVPMLDIPLVTLIHAKLFHSIGSVYDYPLDWKRARAVVTALAVSLAANAGRRELVKLIPVYGAGVSSLLTATSTYALGKTLIAYIERGRQGVEVDREALQALYGDAFAQGRGLLVDTFTRRRGGSLSSA